jgi:hypothetical protein
VSSLFTSENTYSFLSQLRKVIFLFRSGDLTHHATAGAQLMAKCDSLPHGQRAGSLQQGDFAIAILQLIRTQDAGAGPASHMLQVPEQIGRVHHPLVKAVCINCAADPAQPAPHRRADSTFR